MQPVGALTETDHASASQSADAATAAYWLPHLETPERRKTVAHLLDQWESEPEWKDTDPPCPK
jgi:hypothetical protein